MTGPLAAIWEIPEPLSVHGVEMDDGEVILLRRHGNPKGPRLVLSHGNGLAADLYYPFWSLLCGGFDLVVHDLRNHGWNELGTLKDHGVDAFARDHDRIFDSTHDLFGEKPTVGVFHSISALAALHTPSRGGLYSALALFAPPICNAGPGYGEFELRARRTADMLRRRAQWFRSREELADLHTYLPYFQGAVPGVYELVARTTLRESQTGHGYELRCPSEYEAHIWDNVSVFAASADFDALRCPTIVVSQDPATLVPDIPAYDYGGADVELEFIPGTSHFLQLERPDLCTAVLLRFLSQLGISGNQPLHGGPAP